VTGVPESSKEVPAVEDAERIVAETGEPLRYIKRKYLLFRDRMRYTLRIPVLDLLDLSMFLGVGPDRFPERLRVPVVFDVEGNRLIFYLGEAEVVGNDS